MRWCAAIWIGTVLAVSAEVETLETVTVYSLKHDDMALVPVDTAADVTVIDREMIERSGTVSVPDLLRREANVLMRSTTGQVNDGQIALRGFGENSHLRTLVLVDGHKQNRPDMGVMNWDSIPLTNIERIEVIRGSQNVLYGSHALGGVINITTKRGADVGTQVKGVFGEHGYLSGYLGHGGSLGPVDYFISADSYESRGYRSNSVARATGVTGSLAWFPGDTDTVSLRLSHTDSSRQLPGPLDDDQMQEDPTQSNYDASDVSDSLNSQASLIWKTVRGWGEARMTTGFNRRDLSWSIQGRYADNLQHGLSLGPRVRFGSAETFLLAGTDVLYDELEFREYLSEERNYVGGEADLNRFTVQPYVFAQKTFSKHWILGGGARYETAATDGRYLDYVDLQVPPVLETNRGQVPNPDYKNRADLTTNSFDGVIHSEGWAATVSLTRELNRNTSGWIRYDRVYRSPVFDEMAAYQGYPLADPFNENLEPERGDHFVTGFDWAGDAWRVSWSAYALLMENEIAFDGSVNRNLDRTRRLGTLVELAMDRDAYGAGTRWTFQDARFAAGPYEGHAVPLAPAVYGNVSGWIEPFDPLRLSLVWSYTGEQYEGNDDENAGGKMEGYGLLALHVQIRMAPYATLNMSMDNLLNKTYAASAYSGAYYPGAGRTVRVGMTMEF